MTFVRAFLRQAEEILDIAVSGDRDAGDLAILIDTRGGMRMLDPSGWSLPALCAEFGAAAVYSVARRGSTVRVEGWGGGDRCLLQRNLGPRRPVFTSAALISAATEAPAPPIGATAFIAPAQRSGGVEAGARRWCVACSYA